MKNIIIGTAGHIDHGKTTLIKALTGRNTDRWEEEQRRGITIDLGFTYFDLPGGDRAGIIDVPGHEKFINNMVAGVVGMDLVLLVIAADEGIMPLPIRPCCPCKPYLHGQHPGRKPSRCRHRFLLPA